MPSEVGDAAEHSYLLSHEHAAAAVAAAATCAAIHERLPRLPQADASKMSQSTVLANTPAACCAAAAAALTIHRSNGDAIKCPNDGSDDDEQRQGIPWGWQRFTDDNPVILREAATAAAAAVAAAVMSNKYHTAFSYQKCTPGHTPSTCGASVVCARHGIGRECWLGVFKGGCQASLCLKCTYHCKQAEQSCQQAVSYP
jgi:hypothetical protein